MILKRLLIFALLLPAPALAGEVRGQASLDFLRAESRDAAPTDGIDPKLTAQELGMRLRLDLKELDDRLLVHLDYRGREPVGGNLKNQELRLLYRAEIGYELLEKKLLISLGRFVAPATLMLPIDGLRVDYKPLSDWRFMAFGGRRAISVSRRNLGFDRFRPAVGAQVSFTRPWLQLELAGAYTEDQAILIKGSRDNTEEVERNYGSGSLYARAFLRPIRQLMVGAQLAFLEQARYVLGPTWNSVEVDVEGFNVWNANAFADWRPLKQLQIDYTFHFQRATAYRAGLRLTDGGELDPDQAPTFIDNRLRIGWRPFNLGWIRARGRLRIRPDRQERRIGGSIRADRLGLRGLYVQGRLLYENIAFDQDVQNPPELDRLRWSAALGYRNYGVDAQVGARLIERFGSPVSGRFFNPAMAQLPDSIVDLSPFTLQTQRIFFLRAFYNRRFYFLGLDFERNLEDNEFRFMVQAGAFVDRSW